MANKAINQFPNTATRLDDEDLIYVVRSGQDYKMPAALLPPALQTATVVLTSAQVLTLFTTPVLAVPSPAADKILWPRMFLVEFSGGSANYAANTHIGLGTDPVEPVLAADISDRSKPNAAYAQANGTLNAGEPLVLAVISGNPTTGDSDLTITIWYSVLNA